MLGLIRTLFALMVMSHHLFFNKIPMGIYPVFGFYIISGYLMTLIMHENYGYTRQGRTSFAINRFLRLYPQYWAAAMISIFLIYILGSDVVKTYHLAIFLPATVLQYIENIAMGFVSWNPSVITPRLVPPTWALTVEIFFYILICVGISKTVTRVKIWFFLSLLYVIGSFVLGFSWEDRYYPFAAASLPFAIGAGIYFLSKNEEVYVTYLRLKISPLLIFLLILGNCFIFAQIGVNTFMANLGVYINLGLCALLVYGIVRGGKIVGIGEHLDKKIGDFSYPIYILHWQAGLLVSYLLYGKGLHEYSFKGLVTWLISLILVFLLAFIFITVLDKPIQNIRSRIKGNVKSIKFQ